METLLQKFAGKIDTQSLVRTVEELKMEYIDDGLTKEDIPPILGRLMMESMKCEKDSEFEIVLKSIVPPMVDSFAAMLKTKQAVAKCLPCLA